MSFKSLNKLDRICRLNANQNYLLFHENYSFTSLPLKKKRVLSFLLKKIIKYLYTPSSDKEILKHCFQILQYFFKTLNPEQEKVEEHLLEILDNLVVFTNDSQMFEQLISFYQQIIKKKQKYENILFLTIKFIGLLILSNFQENAKNYIEGLQYNPCFLNSHKFYMLFKNLKVGEANFEEYQKRIKNKNINTDIVLDMIELIQKEDKEMALRFAQQYSDLKTLDSFLIKKKIFQLSYEVGESLDQEEILNLARADMFDLSYIDIILNYIEFEYQNEEELMFEINFMIIFEVLEINQGNIKIWTLLKNQIQKLTDGESNINKKNKNELHNMLNQKKDELILVHFNNIFSAKRDIQYFITSKDTLYLKNKFDILQMLIKNEQIENIIFYKIYKKLIMNQQ